MWVITVTVTTTVIMVNPLRAMMGPQMLWVPYPE